MKQSRVGDVFRIPIDESRCGFGQLVANLPPNPWYMVIFEPLFPKQEEDLQKIVASNFLFVANSFDSMIKHGYWNTIGNCKPDLQRVPFPWYLVAVNDKFNIEIVSYDDKSHRKATEEEASLLELRSSIAPAVLDAGLKAFHGLQPWKSYFDKYKFENVKKRAL